MAKTCSYIKPDGITCKAYAGSDSDYCYFHDPEKAEDRAAARSRGGKTTGNSKKARAIIGELINEVEVLETGNGTARVQINTLDDLQLFAEKQIQYIEDNKRYAELSQKDRSEMRRWSEFLLKLLIVRGLGAEQRIKQLEELARKQLSPLNL